MKKKKHVKKSPKWVLIAAIAAVALVLGVGIGMVTDPLPPSTCAARLAQIGAPHGVDSFVCYGQRPN